MLDRWDVRFSGAANRDFDKILVWTLDQFGSAQAKAYAALIKAAVERLEDGPRVLGTVDRPELGSGRRTLHIARAGGRGRHLLVFKAREDGTIEILRILHDAMDLSRHIPPSGLFEDPAAFAP